MSDTNTNVNNSITGTGLNNNPNTELPSIASIANPFSGASQWFNTIQSYADENPMLMAALGLGLVLLASNAYTKSTISPPAVKRQ